MAFILCGAVGSAQNKTYEVKAGETLYSIANKQNVAVDSILKWNNLQLVTTNKKDKKGNPIKEVQPAIKKGQLLIVGKASSEIIKVEKGEKQTTPTVKEEVSKEQTPKTKTEQEEKKTEKSTITSEEDKTKSKSDSRRERNQKKEKDCTSYQNSKKSLSWWWFWLIAGFGCGIFCWEKWLREKILLKDKSKKTANTEFDALNKDYKSLHEKNKQLVNQVKERDNQIKKIEKQYNEIFEENIKLGEQIDGYQFKAKSFSEITQEIAGQTRNEGKTVVGKSQNTTLYANSILDDHFNHVTETPADDTIFELHLKSEKSANFTVYHRAKELVVLRPEFLDGGIEPGIGSNLDNLSEGTAQRQPDGKWKIINKLNVIIN